MEELCVEYVCQGSDYYCSKFSYNPYAITDARTYVLTFMHTTHNNNFIKNTLLQYNNNNIVKYN